MTTPLGSASQFAWGFELANGVPNTASLYGLLVASEGFPPKIGSEATKNISPISHALKTQRVKIDIGGNLDRQPDVDSIARLRAHFWEWAEITNPVTGVYAWECRPRVVGVDAAMADYIETIYGRRYTNDDYEERIDCGRIGKTTLKFDRNKIIDLSQSALFGTTTHLAEPTEVAVNAAYTGQLVFRGWGDETDTRKIRLKATVAGALNGTAKVECTLAGTGTIATTGTTTATGTGTKFLTEYAPGDLIMVGTETVRTVGAVASDTSMTVTVAFSNTASGLAHWIAYGGASRRIAITAGDWYTVVLSDGERMGANYPHAKIEFMFTSGGVFTLDDEWQVAQQKGQSTVSYVQKQPLTAVGLTLSIAGSEVEIESGSLEIDRPIEAYFSTGSASARRVNNQGMRKAMLSVKLRYQDRTFLRLARSGAKVAFNLQMDGARIGSTAYYEGWNIAAPNFQIDEAGNDGIKGPNSFDEEIKGELSYDPDTGNPAIVETITTAVATVV